MNMKRKGQGRTGVIIHLVLAAVLSFVLVSTASAEAFRAAEGGVRVKDLNTGSGEMATEGMIATIHVTGWLDDAGTQGKELYNTRNAGTPVSFVVGTEKVMPAWNAGVVGMRAGGRRLLLIPPAMAYGNRSINEAIPANASLRMTIELLELRSSP